MPTRYAASLRYMARCAIRWRGLLPGERNCSHRKSDDDCCCNRHPFAHHRRLAYHRQPPIAHRPSTVFLGEIVIAKGVAKRQARLAGHAELAELRLLALHGLLHLIGYDHHGGSVAMARIEKRLRLKGGLREGLIERANTQ